MNGLPAELLVMIIDQLWEDPSDYGPSPSSSYTNPIDSLLINLRSVRLVCKGFREAASNIFEETYFQTRSVSLCRKSLLDLIKISESAKFSRHVCTLRIRAIRFDRHLHENGLGVSLLSKALKNLDGTVRSVMMSVSCPNKLRDCRDEAKIMEATIYAICRSKIQLSHLTVNTNKPNVVMLPTDNLRSSHARNMQHLRSTRLEFLNSSSLDTEIHQILAHGSIDKFINAMPLLQELSIHFTSEIWYRAPLSRILGTATQRNLKTLRLCGFNAREIELVDFLIHHRNTLRSLELADFKLRNGQWRHVFSALHDRLSLEKLWFRRIWDRDEVFQNSSESLQGYIRGDSDFVDWDSIVSPRDNSDDDLEPIQLGVSGIFISFPEDLLYDPDDVDDDDGVNPIPFFAHELLHPGLSGHVIVDEENAEDPESECNSSSADEGSGVIDMAQEHEDAPREGVGRSVPEDTSDQRDLERYFELYDYADEGEDFMNGADCLDGSAFWPLHESEESEESK
ncbi:uncharacterized protein K441DRAFT_626830 [Cenococcum geophilum 1.58]|uniref:uncharacterized protein n=1 Tax=Cenococcum geophilum 1.58 TaxID=794803 RepID=UPI00358F7303|nr:hypothetical protein K441DRAFT_626830 [Cenococcum geophilum 1.58]